MAKGRKTGGRVKGIPNKFTSDVRELISCALMKAGGAKYLEEQAQKNPPAFMALLGRTLPKDVNLSANGSLKLTISLSK